jgi:RNA-splicing ligase RtcB
MFTINGKNTTAKVMIDNVEPTCVSQITHFTNHPAFTNPVSIMPDCHYGNGTCVGFTMEMTDKIIPNVVGVDIGCGIKSINIGKNLDISLEMLDHKIRKTIPFGIDIHNRSIINMERNFPWKNANNQAVKFAMAYFNKFSINLELPQYNIDWFQKKSKKIGGDLKRMINSIGTLGGGNHFLEVGISNDNSYWITIHSGSRNFGKKICEYWQNRAKKIIFEGKKFALQEQIKEIKETYKEKPRLIKEKIKEAKEALNLNNNINMKGCEWLEGNDATGYLFDMIFSQLYAQINREYMARVIEKIIGIDRIDEIETVHNFIDFHDFIIRKGAVRSYKDERMVIPFNMRDGLLICEGKSNEEWNYSAPHGAGRVMSRSQANKSLNFEEFKNQMRGIYSTSVNKNTIDEAPGAYKDSKIIENSIKPTANIIDKIKPVLNMKSGGEFIRKKGKK